MTHSLIVYTGTHDQLMDLLSTVFVCCFDIVPMNLSYHQIHLTGRI